MKQTDVVEISDYRSEKKNTRKRERLNKGRKGRVYSRVKSKKCED